MTPSAKTVGRLDHPVNPVGQEGLFIALKRKISAKTVARLRWLFDILNDSN
jgi:hypothetical protein